MKRAIVTPPSLPTAALAELKQWLGIATTRDDAELTSLLKAALDMCEAFTGIMPLEATCEEVLPVATSWQSLATRPVQAITEVQGIPADSAHFVLPAANYAVELDADGSGRVLVVNPASAGRIAVRFVAGLSVDWDHLPEPLRHGIVRLAAHQHRARDADAGGPVPPASVVAMWRPWRRMRLA